MSVFGERVGFGAVTLDTPAPGVQVLQPKVGYRWGAEVYALTKFALEGTPSPPATVVELGSGSGVVSLLLAAAGCRVWAVELDSAWVALSRESAGLCTGEIREKVTFLQGDVRAILAGAAPPELPRRVDLVVTNPPWFDPAQGPISPDPRKAAARTMLAGNVADFLAAAQRLSDRVCVITRAERAAELDAAVFSRKATLGRRVVLGEWRREPSDADEPIRGFTGRTSFRS